MQRLILAAIAALLFMQGSPAQAGQADNAASAADNCEESRGINLPEVKIKTCTSSTMTTPLVGDVSGYYGKIAMDVSGGGTIGNEKAFGKVLRSFLGIKDDFMATISVSVSDKKIVIYERPLLLVNVKKNGGSEIAFGNTLASASDVTPFFPLQDQGPLQVELKITHTKAKESTVIQTLSKGVDLLTELGGPGWLLNAASNEAYMAAAAKAEGAVNRLYSSRANLTSTTDLNHEGAAFKRVSYQITIQTGKNSKPLETKIEMYLKSTPSLITQQMQDSPLGHVPNVNINGFVSDWASKIVLNRKPEIQTLADYLRDKGVPTKLSGLSVSPLESGPVPRAEVVNTACMALKDALEGAPLRLSDADRDLVLFSELKKRGVFEVFDANELSCLSDVRGAWVRKYALVVPSPKPNYAVSVAEKTERLDRLARHWALPSPETRANLLAEEDFTNPVRLTAAANLLPGMPAPVQPDSTTGLATWELDPKHLALLRKHCFGNQRPTAPTDRWQTAFAQFEGSSRSYLVTLNFKTDERWGRGGPLIQSLTVKPATAEDRRNFNHNNNCLADEPALAGA